MHSLRPGTSAPTYSLELVLKPGQTEHSFTADLTLSVEDGPIRSWPDLPVTLDSAALLQLLPGPQRFGAGLRDALFAGASLRAAWHQAEDIAQGAPLHVQLGFSAGAEQLQRIPWELLIDPNPGYGRLALNQSRPLSRRVARERAVPITYGRRPARLRVLALVANPRGLDDPHLGLSPLDGVAEGARLRAIFAREELALLGRSIPGSSGPASLEALTEQLRAAPELVILLGHGAFDGQTTALYLESAGGELTRVPGGELASAVIAQARRPLLLLLATCESSGQSFHPDLLESIGPSLARAGVAAVVAMQDRVRITSMGAFIAALGQELLAHGQVDRAVVVARGAISTTDDWWKPALFLRPRDGRLWSLQNNRPGGRMNYEAGLHELRAMLERSAPDELDEFLVLEARLLDTLSQERLYGSTETTRAGRAVVVGALNTFTRRLFPVDFNSLCRL